MKTTLTRALQIYRDAYTGHPREVWALATLTVINRMGTMVLPFLTVYMSTVLGFSLSDAGLLAGAFGLGALGGSYLAGRLSDHLGPDPVILASLLVSGVFFISLQYAEGFYSLFVLIFCTGLFGEAYRPAVMASVGSYVPSSRVGRSMAFLRLAASLGIELLDEAQYRHLQTLGAFDTKTSSWLRTPPAIRQLGGALFGDRRYGQVFTYHNGAESYYAARGFRGLLTV